jgi:hypothetical protein
MLGIVFLSFLKLLLEIHLFDHPSRPGEVGARDVVPVERPDLDIICVSEFILSGCDLDVVCNTGCEAATRQFDLSIGELKSLPSKVDVAAGCLQFNQSVSDLLFDPIASVEKLLVSFLFSQHSILPLGRQPAARENRNIETYLIVVAWIYALRRFSLLVPSAREGKFRKALSHGSFPLVFRGFLTLGKSE